MRIQPLFTTVFLFSWDFIGSHENFVLYLSHFTLILMLKYDKGKSSDNFTRVRNAGYNRIQKDLI